MVLIGDQEEHGSSESVRTRQCLQFKLTLISRDFSPDIRISGSP